jgi:hypothetical protein
VESLPPSPGPTQAGTTPRVEFRAVVGTDGTANAFNMVAQRSAQHRYYRLIRSRLLPWNHGGSKCTVNPSTDSSELE